MAFPRPVPMAPKPAHNGGSRSGAISAEATALFVHNIKEATNGLALDEDITSMLIACNYDVNEATARLIDSAIHYHPTNVTLTAVDIVWLDTLQWYEQAQMVATCMPLHRQLSITH